MPGKVNPVIPEMVMQCAMKVQADDYAITLAASHGEFELNAFEPVIADSMLESLKLLISATRIFREKCIETLLPQTERCERILRDSYAFATEYVPKLGYDYVAALVEKELTPGELEKCLKDALENIQAKD
jgi:aspartate ammonia-lyase